MSGFAGVFHLDGAPVDRDWLDAMANFLAFRGPDSSQVWISGNASLCHTLLRTRAEQDNHPQIASLDDSVWIAGDIRIDDRETLFAKLSVPIEVQRNASSAELVLHAYAKWGEACVEHLLGDFSFVIWDARQQRVFAARDHLGVKPFFYAQVGQCLLISNTLDCIRQIPIVSNELNEQAIGDFLLVGENKNPATTFFTAIQRLPVAHRLVADADGTRTERYWTLPIDEPVYFKHADDYVDRFRELLCVAVRDRLPDGPLGILMSGGLDSPALAVIAVQLGAATTAFTSVFDRLIPDQERHYAGLVARHLKIPIRYTVRDDELWGWEPAAEVIRTPEPLPNPLSLVSNLEYHREIATHARVFFFGDGPDAALLYEWRSHLSWLIQERRWLRVGRDLIADFAFSRRVPILHRLPRIWGQQTNADWYQPEFPSWFNKDFEIRLGLKDRWKQLRNGAPSPHPIRPAAYGCFACDFPMGGVESFDAGYTRTASDFFHPFWDLRLLRFMLTVPAVPWARNKYLIRRALRGQIPEAVRLRPKSPLGGFPYLEQARRLRLPELPSVPKLDCYIDSSRLSKQTSRDREDIDRELRVLGLRYWLLGL